MRHKTHKTIIQSISFQLDVWDYLQDKPNKSGIVNQAIKEFIKNKTQPEYKIRKLREEAAQLNKRLSEIQREINDIFSLEMRQKDENNSS